MANLREDNVPNRGAVGRNRKKVKVFLEGKDDLAFLSLYWFPELKDRIDFRLAQEGPIPESGCNGVRKNVRFLREQGSSLAFGILDRDAIPDAIEACELDDHQFLNRNSEREPFIYYTLFWEIENYLIQAEPMEEERCDSSRDPEPCRPIAEVHQELREHCQTLIPYAALNATRKAKGISHVGNGATNRHDNREHSDSVFRRDHLQKASEAELADYQTWMERIEAFDSYDEPDATRVQLMQRRIDGKAILQRFFNRRKIDSDPRWHLARKCQAPQELTDKLLEWVNHL